MKNAWSLYLGREVSADEALLAPGSLRPVCPRCEELVHLVRRLRAPHFSHWPRTPDSPRCTRRVTSGGGESTPSPPGPSREERWHESQAFRRALLEAHGLPAPEAPGPPTLALLREVAELIQNTWRTGEQVFPRSASALISEVLRGPDVGSPELNTTVQRELVLHLWRHLHLPQVEDDLSFLLLLALVSVDAEPEEIEGALSRTTAFAGFVDRLLFAAIRLLALVPWRERMAPGPAPPPPRVPPRDPKPPGPVPGPAPETPVVRCDDCHDPLGEGEGGYCQRCRVPLCAEHAEQHAKWSCPDCGQNPCDTRSTGPFVRCWVCEEWLCSECCNPCECCGEEICDDCFHDRWSCEGCGEEFCDNQPEEEEKSECPACDLPYCERCAEEYLLTCAECKGEICQQCSEECSDCGAFTCDGCADAHQTNHDPAFV